MIHPLMVLGFDVYAQPVDVERRQADVAGVRPEQGAGGHVEGAEELGGGDGVARLAVAGVLGGPGATGVHADGAERAAEGAPGKNDIAEIQFNEYEKLGGGWIAIEVAFYNNGERVQTEQYADVKADPVLEPGLFEPGEWKKPGWVLGTATAEERQQASGGTATAVRGEREGER